MHCESCDHPATRKDACGTALCGKCWSADESPRPIPLTATEEEQAFFETMAQFCKCRSGDCPCDGVLAGGICDDVQDRDVDDEPDVP